MKTLSPKYKPGEQMFIPGMEPDEKYIIQNFIRNVRTSIENDEPTKAIDALEDVGYKWLIDFNSGKFLTKNKKEAYVPYRIQFPSGLIMDEREIFNAQGKLEKIGWSQQEMELARLYHNAINHEDLNPETYRFDGYPFVSDEDKEETIERYLKEPFYKEAC